MERYEGRDGCFSGDKLEVIDYLVIEVKDGVYLGHLERQGLKGIKVDKEVYETHYKDSNVVKIFGRIALKNYSVDEYTHYISKDSFKPLDDINPNILDLKNFKGKLSQKEWLDIILETLGYNSSQLLFWEKILILVRLIPHCEKSYHIMELGKEKIGNKLLHDLFNDDISNLEVSMTLEELMKNKDPLTEEKSFLITSDLKDSEMKIEFKEGLFNDFNIDLQNNHLFNSLCYFIPNHGIREIDEFRIEPNQKELPLDYLSKVLKRLRNINLLDNITQRVHRLISVDSDNDIKAISKTISGLIKILHLGNIPSDQEFLAYLAIAIKSRYLLNQQMIIANKGNYDDKGFSLEKYPLIQQNFKAFIARIEGISPYDDLHMIPNRMTSDSGEWITYHALDAIGFNKNRRVNPNQVNSKDVSKAKRWIPIISKDQNINTEHVLVYSEYLSPSNYFIDCDAEFQDNLFGERILRSSNPQNNVYFPDHSIIYLDNSVVYSYKKTLPNQIECLCGEKASLVKYKYFYDKDNTEVPHKEVKKQLLRLGVI